MPYYAIVEVASGEVTRVTPHRPALVPPGRVCVRLSDGPARGDAAEVAAGTAAAARQAPLTAARLARAPRRRARDAAWMRARLADEMAAGQSGRVFCLLVFEAARGGAQRPEEMVRGALLVLGTSLGATDVMGRLSPNTIGILMQHAGVPAGRAVFSRLQYRLSQLPGRWRGHCFSYPADRGEMERWRGTPAA